MLLDCSRRLLMCCFTINSCSTKESSRYRLECSARKLSTASWTCQLTRATTTQGCWAGTASLRRTLLVGQNFHQVHSHSVFPTSAGHILGPTARRTWQLSYLPTATSPITSKPIHQLTKVFCLMQSWLFSATDNASLSWFHFLPLPYSSDKLSSIVIQHLNIIIFCNIWFSKISSQIEPISWLSCILTTNLTSEAKLTDWFQ